MCLTSPKSCSIPSVDGFKIFSVNGNDELQSAFASAYFSSLKYQPDVCIRVLPESNSFSGSLWPC